MFYDKFKYLCEKKGVSCNKAALEMGLSNATPTKWKKTGATPDSKTLEKVSSYFGVPIFELFSGVDPDSPMEFKIPTSQLLEAYPSSIESADDHAYVVYINECSHQSCEHHEDGLSSFEKIDPKLMNEILSILKLFEERPDLLNLLEAAKESTKKQVEAAIAMLQTLQSDQMSNNVSSNSVAVKSSKS